MNQQPARQNEKGFTLVELAIVMIIIGLLIGGVLKGQELINNARIAAAVTKLKSVDAAMNTFSDSYNGLPGDITNSTARLPSCGAGTICASAPAGNLANGRIDTAAPGAAHVIASENIVAWSQLASADLIGGVQPGLANTVQVQGNAVIPEAEVPGQLVIGYGNGAAMGGQTAAAPPRAGHYVLIHNAATNAGGTSAAAAAPTSATAFGTASLSPGIASRIDIKMDDGAPNTGSVLAMGAAGANTFNCVDANTPAGVYASAQQSSNCGVYVRIGQ